MAEGPFGGPGTPGKPLTVVHRGGSAREVRREAGRASPQQQTHGSPEPTHAIKSHRPSRFVLVAGLAALFGTATALAIAAENSPLLTSDQIRDITFSDACTQKEWSAQTAQGITLALGSTNSAPCRAEILFNEPVATTPDSRLHFEASGDRKRQTLLLELRRRGEDAIESVKLKPRTVMGHWEDVDVLFSAQSKSMPKSMTSLVLVVEPPENTIQIRAIGMLHEPAAPSAAEVTIVPAQAVVAAPVKEPKKSASHPTVPATPAAKRDFRWPTVNLPGTPELRSLVAGVGIPLLLLGFVGAFFRRLKIRHHASQISPLFEINMRTWKSRRDAEGVAHLGGLRSLTAEDLQQIKDSGFSAIWLMGLWEVGQRVRAMSKQYGEDYQGSPYAIYDYKVSQDLGTEEDLDAVVREAHRLGLKVFVDFVPNHMGIDSIWLNTHPEFFLHKLPAPEHLHLSDEELLQRYPSYFPYRTPAYPDHGRRVAKTILVAYGRDPYFYPWIDTAQLDYANPDVRKHLTDMLCRFAKRVDGVRCDMAMLVLREQIKIHRHPEMSREEFDRFMPQEFWSEAIQAVKRVNPNFFFIAETYWSMEGNLQQLGFDYTYNKPLYEAICGALQAGHAEGLMNFLRMLGTDYLKRSVHFLENHDEERAMNVLGEDRQRAAAVMLCTLPGLALVHQGQMEGRRERLPVQRVVPLQDEADNQSLSLFYKHLMQATALPVFREGRLHVQYCQNPAIIAYARGGADQQALVVINASAHTQRGFVFVTPGLRLESSVSYWLHDLFYDLKSASVRELEGVQPAYQCSGAQLIKQGLYVELQPYDAHVFLVAPDRVRAHKKRFENWLRSLNREWGLPLPARRLFGPVLTRAIDQTWEGDVVESESN